ncbi:HAAS signaling domain-containing protein [Spongisporangium articulatum]|uniref:HAAS signaling domain-containing protein n=1 Tax=Spongisporangium articulatum TaxID=3362603 RepID=A0ABW8AKJ3_9ACTN
MTTALDHPAVRDYLARLNAAAAVLPPGRRVELIAEIRGHLAEALTGEAVSDAAVLATLDRLGDPAEIVAAEGGPQARPPLPPLTGVPNSPWGALEIVAVLLLTVGSLVLPGMGPLVGIVLAWVSPAWTRRQKVIATVIAVVPAFLALLAGFGALLAFSAP